MEVWDNRSLVVGPNALENDYVRLTVNGNGTADVLCKRTERTYRGLNYLRDQGETGNAWKHEPPAFDRVFNSLGCAANVSVREDGPLVAAIAAEFAFQVPADYADGTRRSENLETLPVEVVYRLVADNPIVKIELTVDNRARDHWLRACFPTGVETNISVTDSHFDVLQHPIPLPDSTGWVERAFGTRPLQTFVDLADENGGLAVLPRGLFEYEAIDDAERTLALTLLRACRIKLAVSEEKQTELPDEGVQCPGPRTFEYALCVHEGDWRAAQLQSCALEAWTPVRAAQVGRGQGDLPLEDGVFTLDNAVVQVSAVKPVDNGEGLIVRLFNPSDREEITILTFGRELKEVTRETMAEEAVEPVPVDGMTLQLPLLPHKIVTLRVQ